MAWPQKHDNEAWPQKHDNEAWPDDRDNEAWPQEQPVDAVHTVKLDMQDGVLVVVLATDAIETLLAR